VSRKCVTAARALGFGDFQLFLIISYLIMAPVIVISAANFASAILVESSFLVGLRTTSYT
jgi:peptide/nickel transport system permease protein